MRPGWTRRLMPLAVTAVIAALAGCSSSPSTGSSGTTGTHLTGTMNDWANAVCRTAPLPMSRGATMPGASNPMSCTGAMQKANGGRMPVPISIGNYQSESVMQSDLGGLGGYAVGNDGSQYVVFGAPSTASAPAQRAESAMFQPLASYGFTVH